MTAEHPAVRTRRLALARLARRFPDRCLADREDAVHEAIAHGLHAGRAGEARWVAWRAAVVLLGTFRLRGVRRPWRSLATSSAGGAMDLRDGVGPGSRTGAAPVALPPDDWLDASGRAAEWPDFEAALDLAVDVVGPAELRALVQGALAAAGSPPKLARALGVHHTTVYRWRDRPSDDPAPGAEHLRAMRALCAA